MLVQGKRPLLVDEGFVDPVIAVVVYSITLLFWQFAGIQNALPAELASNTAIATPRCGHLAGQKEQVVTLASTGSRFANALLFTLRTDIAVGTNATKGRIWTAIPTTKTGSITIFETPVSDGWIAIGIVLAGKTER